MTTEPDALRQAAQITYDFLQDKSFIPDSDTHRCTAILEALDAALRETAAPAATTLTKAIEALLQLDAANALVPHGVGGLARELLTDAKAEIEQLQTRVAELEGFEGSAQLVATEALRWWRGRPGDGQGVKDELARRMAAAIEALDAESRKNPRTADEAFAKYLPNLDNPRSD